jgi:hypothetical protein
MSLIFQPAMVATKREIMLNLPTQHKPGILQGLVVEQPVQLCPLCRGVAVFVLHVWRSFRWKFIKRKSLKLLGTSRSFRLYFA